MGKTLQELQEQKKQFTAVYDYNKFLFDELEEAAFKENELEDLDGELKLLSNAEGIKGALSAVSYELNEGEQPLVQQVKRMLQQLQGLCILSPCIARFAATSSIRTDRANRYRG